ncbi:hypothetical protein Tco_1253897 [Tanacetum coccineum]
MEFRMITKKAQASSREIPPGKTIKEGRTETDSLRTRDPTMDCSPTCPKAQERSWQPRRLWTQHELVSGDETSNRRSYQIRTASTSSKRSKEEECESFGHSIRRKEEGRQRYNTY